MKVGEDGRASDHIGAIAIGGALGTTTNQLVTELHFCYTLQQQRRSHRGAKLLP